MGPTPDTSGLTAPGYTHIGRVADGVGDARAELARLRGVIGDYCPPDTRNAALVQLELADLALVQAGITARGLVASCG